MTTALIAAYILVALLTARWMYRLNVEADQIDTASLNDVAINATMAIVIGLFWPLVWAWLGALRFIVKPKGDNE